MDSKGKAMSPKPWYLSTNIAIYQIFISAFNMACGLHSITAIWLTYEFTQNPFIVSLIIVAGYLPSAIAGFTWSEWFSRGNPYKKLQSGVLILATSMTLMVVTLMSSLERYEMSLVVIILIQVVLSLVKLSNQSALAILNRSIFSKQQSKRVMELASSNLLVSLSIGAGLAGLLLSFGMTYMGPIVAAILFFLAWMGMKNLERLTVKSSLDLTPLDRKYLSCNKVSLLTDRSLQTLILFSICSSGTLQYINATLAPLANHIVANEPSYFSLLDVLSMLGGFIAGVILSTNRLKSRLVLDHALLAIAAITGFLAITSDPILVAILMFMLSLIATAHVISMQVKTNQTPDKAQVSQYTVLRNASVSVAKIGFSLLAGTVTTVVDIQTSWWVLSMIAVGFSILWYIFPPIWREDSTHLQESLQK
jgi:predicted MFS family arabinose efflux permease